MKPSFRLWLSLHLITALSMLLAGCSSGPPPKSTHDNLCSIYYFDDDWYDAAEDSYDRWGIPPYVLMAFVHQESRFQPDAQPDRPYFLGFIPLPRPSSAYGYAQAQDEAWYDYQKATGRWGADRDDIDDALDFIGWYNNRSHQLLGIAKTDAYNLYLAYHEGHGGYKRKTYNGKAWLKKVASKVSTRANLYKKQSANCR
ncbi:MULTISPECIES: transglycosylase SLT domain-containing protein [Thiomicrorhabdus]|nr:MULTISPECIES: transglycosylase SLT domain-containing protein [Thiomicrorhabdus]